MGTSYDAGVVYGLLYSDGEDNWPLALLREEPSRGFDLDDWLDQHLGVTEWDLQEATWRAWQDERREKCTARYGVPWFDYRWTGYIEYAAYIVHVEGGHTQDWRMVSIGDLSVDPTHEEALRRLAEDLPGADGPPRWWAYCSVG